MCEEVVADGDRDAPTDLTGWCGGNFDLWGGECQLLDGGCGAAGATNISTFLRGEINAGLVKPGDTIEYTVYFLNAGGSNAKSVRICDRITTTVDP